jgi:hypothetical protein
MPKSTGARPAQGPSVGEMFYPCLESEAVAKKIDIHGSLGGKRRSLKPVKIKEVFHETQVPAGMARTWCIKIGDTCYDAAWSEEMEAWVYGGANSGIKTNGA